MDNQQPSINMNIWNKEPKRGYGFIYCYTSPSGKKYVGQTQQTLSKRAHSFSGKGYKGSVIFYKAIQKYSLENFKVEILEEAQLDLLDEKEKEWIKFLNTQTPYGYNISEGGCGCGRRVFQYDAKTGKFMAEFPSLTEAAKVNKLNTIQYISDCLHKRRKSSHGYIWDFNKYDQVEPQDYFPNDKRPVYAYTLDGKFFKEFESIAAAAAFINGNRNDIRKAIKGELKFSKGYIWMDEKYNSVQPVYTGKNGATPVAQIDISTGEIIQIFSSQSEAARALNLARSTGISKCCVGKSKTCAGYRWEFYKGSTTTGS